MILGKEKDKTDTEVTVHLLKIDEITKELNVFFLKQWADLVERGHASSNYIPEHSSGSTRILYATIDDQIVGHILFEFTTSKDSFIHFTVVDERFRRHGLYQLMHKFYDKVMRHSQVARSKSMLHINNTAIIEAAKKIGYSVEYYKMVKEYKNQSSDPFK